MKLLHINSYFSTSGLFQQLYDRQLAQGYDLDVYVPISHQYPKEKLAVTGDYTSVSRNHNQWDRLFFHLKHQKILEDLQSYYTFSEFDLIHAHSTFSNGWLARQIALEHNIPYVVAVRNADVRTFFAKMPWLRNMGLEILRDAAQIVFISKSTCDQVFAKYIPPAEHETFKAKTRLIANGIDDFWHENRYDSKPLKLHRPLKIVSVGKLTPGKRFIQLADMIESYNQIYDNAELHVIGPNWNNKVLKQIEQHEAITYHGEMNKEDLKNFYRQMDVFALLSYPETFGLVYPEAMSQGLPVIYTRGEGFDGFFENHQVGVSVALKDQIAFNEALQFICRYYKDLSKNARLGIEYFKWDQIASQYDELYLEVLKDEK